MPIDQVGQSPLFIQGSTWAIENIIETPVDSVLGDPAFVYMNTFSMIFRVVISLEKLFVKKKTRNSRYFFIILIIIRLIFIRSSLMNKTGKLYVYP